MLFWMKPHISNGLLRVGTKSSWLAGAPTMLPGQFGFEGGLSFLKTFHDMLASWIRGTSIPMDGDLFTTDVVLNLSSCITFKSAFISSLSFPTFDAVSKEQGRMTVTFQATSMTSKAASGKASLPLTKQALWSCAAFRVAISGLDMSKTVRIDRMTLTSAGSFPSVNATVVGNNKPLRDWYEQVVSSGASGAGRGRAMRITCLAPDMATSLFSLEFRDAFPFALTVEGNATNADMLTRTKVSLAVSSASLLTS